MPHPLHSRRATCLTLSTQDLLQALPAPHHHQHLIYILPHLTQNHTQQLKLNEARMEWDTPKICMQVN